MEHEQKCNNTGPNYCFLTGNLLEMQKAGCCGHLALLSHNMVMMMLLGVNAYTKAECNPHGGVRAG